MKRFDVAGCTGYCYGGYHMKEDVDGEYVTYESHVEAMKRIAGDPVAQGMTAKQRAAISYAILAINSKPGWAGWQIDELRALLMSTTPPAAEEK